MRPYSGIGVLRISSVGATAPIPIYEEPGVIRCGYLDIAASRELTDWFLGGSDETTLLVTARKAEWLRVERDDAGREAWLLPERRWNFIPWEQFLKGKQISFLKNAPKKQMQVLARPGDENGTPLSLRRPMKVILLQGDWSYVLLDQASGGWIRWRDKDGRLLVGLEPPSAAQSR